MTRHAPKVVFLGDTSLRTPHFGCQLVGQTFREQFARTGLELIASLPTKLELVPAWRAHLEQADLVVINGEGSIHHGRFQNLIDLAGDHPCALVNCVYQENPDNPRLRDFKWISTRESLSAAAVREGGGEAEVVPDVLFASSFLRSFVPLTAPTHDFGFTDCAEKVIKRIGPLRFRHRPGHSPKAKVVGDYLNFLASHRRMAIGRFHAAIACSVMGIPFSTWDSNTWKTEGLMKDMGLGQLHGASREQAMALAPRAFPEEIVAFRREAVTRIEAMFDRLAEIAR